MCLSNLWENEMSEHTSEPWFSNRILTGFGVYSGQVVTHKGPRQVCQLSNSGGKPTMEDARRIVACVNACSGIGTEYLERFGGTTFNDFKRMKGQRDDLLAALELAHDHMRLYLPHYTEKHNVFDAVVRAIAITCRVGPRASCSKSPTCVLSG